MNHVFRIAVSLVTSLALVITTVSAGFALCCLPQTTEMLSQAFSDDASSPYDREELTLMAVATRDFTVGEHTGSPEDTSAEETLAQTIMSTAKSAYDRTGKTSPLGNSVTSDDFTTAPESVVASMEALGQRNDAFALDSDALSHLSDCNDLIRAVIPFLIISAILSIAGCLTLFLCNFRTTLSHVLIRSTGALLCLFIIVGIWAAVDFNGFFTAFHGILFPQGNWTFSSRSLLICMYPTEFWMGMGALWLVGTLVTCIICMLFGLHFRKSKHR